MPMFFPNKKPKSQMQPKTSESLKAFLKRKIPAFNPISKKGPHIIPFSPFSGLSSVSKRMRNFKQGAKTINNSLEKENINLMQSASDKKYETNGKISNILNHPLKSSDKINSLFNKMKNKSSSSANLPLLAESSGLNSKTKTKKEIIESPNENSIASVNLKMKEKAEEKQEEILFLNPNLKDGVDITQKPAEANQKSSLVSIPIKEEENLMLNSDVFISNKSPKASSIQSDLAALKFTNIEAVNLKIRLDRKDSEASNNNNFKFNFTTSNTNNDKGFLNFKRTRDELLLKSFNNSIKANLFGKNILAKKANGPQPEQEMLFNSPSSNLKSSSNSSMLSNKSVKKLKFEENFTLESDKNYFDFGQNEREIVYFSEAGEQNIGNKFKEIRELFKLPSKKFDWNKLMNLTNLPSREFNVIKNCVCFKKYLGDKVQFILLKADRLKEYGLYFKIDPIKRKYYLANEKINREHHE